MQIYIPCDALISLTQLLVTIFSEGFLMWLAVLPKLRSSGVLEEWIIVVTVIETNFWPCSLFLIHIGVRDRIWVPPKLKSLTLALCSCYLTCSRFISVSTVPGRIWTGKGVSPKLRSLTLDSYCIHIGARVHDGILVLDSYLCPR